MKAINRIIDIKSTTMPLSQDLILKYSKLVELHDEIFPNFSDE
jgi:hypothetical protein